MKKSVYYDRLSALEAEGDGTYNLLNNLGVPLSKRKLLTDGTVQVEGDMLVVGAERIPLHDRHRVVEAIRTLADETTRQAKKIEKGTEENKKLKRERDDLKKAGSGAALSEYDAALTAPPRRLPEPPFSRRPAHGRRAACQARVHLRAARQPAARARRPLRLSGARLQRQRQVRRAGLRLRDRADRRQPVSGAARDIPPRREAGRTLYHQRRKEGFLATGYSLKCGAGGRGIRPPALTQTANHNPRGIHDTDNGFR